MKQFKSIVRIALLGLVFWQCGAQSKNSQGPIKILDAYYHLQVGGTPSAGLSRSYFVVLDTLPTSAQPLSMQVDERSLSLEKSAQENTLVGYEQFSTKDSLGEPQLLKVKLQYGEEVLTLSATQIPLQQTINYPSAPPSD